MKTQFDQGVKRSFDGTDEFSTKFFHRFNQVPLNDLIFIEVFSGTAGLTAAVRRMGCQHSAGIDAHVTKQVKSPVIRIDLASTHGQDLLWRILEQPRSSYTFRSSLWDQLPRQGNQTQTWSFSQTTGQPATS